MESVSFLCLQKYTIGDTLNQPLKSKIPFKLVK